MPRRVTLQDLAAHVGVNRSTISLALRDSPRIRAKTRARIQKAAKTLGYRKNPLVAALMSAVRTRREAKSVALGYITNYPTRYGWRPPHHDRPDYFPGAARRAKELGYKLEHLWLGESGMTPERFAQKMATMGITGVLIGRLPPGSDQIHLHWDKLAAVALGLTLDKPDLHRVSEDAFASATLALHHCLAQGRRRIGMVMSEPDDSPNMGDRWQGALLRLHLQSPPDQCVPICEYPARADEFTPRFLDWLDTHRPDVILASRPDPVLNALASRGRALPPGVELCLLVNDKPELGLPGIYLDPAIIGALAVDMLVGMLHRGESGLPDDPHHVLVPGRWMDGRGATVA